MARSPLVISLAALFAFLELCAAQIEANYTSDLQVEANRAAADFATDGNLGKKAWQQAHWIEFSHSMSGATNYPEQATRVAVLWTQRYIYFAFSCKYDALHVFEGEDISKERWELWNRDVAEVFVNPRPERQLHYYEFEVAPNNQWIDLEITRAEKPNHDASWNSGFEHATRIDRKRRVWTAEMRIPLSSMGVMEAKTGMEWRANFFRASGKASTRNESSWLGAPSPQARRFTFLVVSQFCGWGSDKRPSVNIGSIRNK